MKKSLAAAAAFAVILSAVSAAEEPTSQSPLGIDDAIFAGKAKLQLRYRYEHVSDDDFNEGADASTVRLRLNYATGRWRAWSGFAEFDYVAELLANNFSSGAGTSSPSRSQYPIVADPKGADLNQLYVNYDGFVDTRLRLGRQQILLDNHRFVGNVGWRQNVQTYDGVSGSFQRGSNTKFFYGYIVRVNRIFGERSVAGQHDTTAHLLNSNLHFNNGWDLAPYYYYIDNEDAPGFSSATLGALVQGDLKFDGGTLKVRAELATQSDAANNPIAYRAQFFQVSGNWVTGNGFLFGLGLESLGGHPTDAGNDFRTPLATLHAFQGWADQFLTTPGQGIDDAYLNAKYDFGKWKIQSIYHDFSAADGSGHWGSEIDLAASRSLGEHYSLLVKTAFFNADDAAFADARKIWIQLAANY